MYTVALSKASLKYLNSTSFHQANRVIDVLEDLCRNPLVNSIKLHGQLKGLRRAKAGNLRIIFELDIDKKQVFVKAIGPRGNIYK